MTVEGSGIVDTVTRPNDALPPPQVYIEMSAPVGMPTVLVASVVVPSFNTTEPSL